MKTKRKKHWRGFSLIEVIFVGAIINVILIVWMFS